MSTFNILHYLEKRQLGYYDKKKKVYDIYIDKLCCIPVDNYYTYMANNAIGNTFACKFSRNKPNLHVVGCTSEYGKMLVQNTHSDSYNNIEPKYHLSQLHNNAIFNFAWADSHMKLVTACGDQTSKLCSLSPSGELIKEKEFIYNSSVKSVMFCPGSSDLFCGGCQDGTIKLWDARVNNGNSILDFDRNIPNAHGLFGSNLKKKSKVYGVSTVIYKNDQIVISCSSMDPTIKFWDLRKSYRQVTGHTEALSLAQLCKNDNTSLSSGRSGYIDMIMNPQLTHLYASGLNNIIDCYSLDLIDKKPIAQYYGHTSETGYSKISISNDGQYLFSGCMYQRAVIWQTGFPYIDVPIYKLLYLKPDSNKEELSASDWCADTSQLKLVTSSDCMPMIWTMLPDNERKPYDIKFIKLNKYKSIVPRKCTVPIRLTAELKAQIDKDIEESMNKLDIDNTDSEPSNLSSTIPKQSGNMLLTKTKSPSSIQILPKKVTVVPKQIPEVVTPTSSNTKRKKSILSPRSLIDQYLIPINKRKKSDTDIEQINHRDE